MTAIMARRFGARPWRRWPLAGVAGVVGAASIAAAQQTNGLRPSVSSESGTYAESYATSGREARRPASTVRAYANPTFEWMGLQIGASLLWSTEDRFVAQSMNRYYLNPRWSWGQLHIGDWVPEVSRYTASAARIRGGGLELTPWKLRLNVAGGRAQDASDLSSFDAAPQRTLVSGLIGIGDRSRTWFDISALRAVDAKEGTDTLSAAPQENVVAALSGGLSLLHGLLALSGDASGSLFSRDTRAGEIDSLSVPSWSKSLFTPRLSSRADFAWNAETRFSVRGQSVGTQVEYVGPGFTTLGNPYFQNDRREVRLFGRMRLLRGRLSASASVGERRDNLAGDKFGTTTRRTGTLAATAVTGAWLVSSATLMMNGMVREPELARSPTSPDPTLADSLKLANLTMAFTIAEAVRFNWGLPQQITVSASEQKVDDTSPRFGSSLDAISRSIAAEYGVTVANIYVISLRPAYQRFTGSERDEAFTSLTGGISRRAVRSPLTASLTSTYTPVPGGSQTRQDLAAGYRVTDRDNLSVQVRYVSTSAPAATWTERVISMRVAHRW
jgi:hypothetical protein